MARGRMTVPGRNEGRIAKEIHALRPRRQFIRYGTAVLTVPEPDAVLACSIPAEHAEIIDGTPLQGADYREITLIKDGTTEMVDGSTLVLDEESAAEVIAEVGRRGVDVAFDENHSTLYQADQGKSSHAVGWVDRNTLRYEKGVGLRARVEWTDQGAKLIHSRAYRYISPCVVFNKHTGRVRRLHSFAICNRPLTLNAVALKAASDAIGV